MDDKISIADIKEIIELVRAEGKIDSFVFRQGDTEISIARNGVAALPPAASQAPQTPARPVSAAPEQPAPALASDLQADLAEGDIAVKAPLVGTFYRASKPGADPFVEEGQQVSKGDTLCIVEVMKLMNSIKAEITGTVKKVLVEDGAPVEFGQTMMIIGAAA